ncbi:MAG TPA: amylo-alpha-1,6-glucosidase [Candidatus Dormibacteraeota bacterium]|nr:amylo-alpha-1,6-glucosidase [Candidatus Dormibacteraeota bacterium]
MSPVLPRLAFGREICGHWDAATRREWLVTDGTGAYATGTIAQARTRRYHGHLTVALDPPVRRTLVVGGLSETVTSPSGVRQALQSQEWAGGSVDPRGFELVEEFALEGTLPVWRFALAGGGVLEKRLWMPAHSQSTVVSYALLEMPGGRRATLELRPLLTWRDHHGVLAASTDPGVTVDGALLEVRFGAGTVTVRAGGGEWQRGGDWYRRYLLAQEWERGLSALEDLYAPATLVAELAPGESLALVLSTTAAGDAARRPAPHEWRASLAAELVRQETLVERAGLDAEPQWVRRLVLAGDAFVVARDGGASVVAGYPWFSDWGRDAMISIPGIALATGRPEVAESILRTFAGHVDRGMVPARFPEDGSEPDYTSVDATLWFVEALRAHVTATGDERLVDELWGVLEEIVRWHLFGTRHGIQVDPGDGLLRAGAAGLQLTWMDAKVGDRVVTPRTGKPVEVNALWYNALRSMERWASTRPSRHDHGAAASRVAAGFERYWDAQRGGLVDVLDGPAGTDRSVRPNQLVAAALEHSPLDPARVRAIVESAMAELRTSIGVRTLAPDDPFYRNLYTGDVDERDGAYHQGTAWPWLLGPLAAAHLRAHGDRLAVRRLLAPLEHHVADAGLGSVSEIADGDPPHHPRGCPWQAWSVAEALRAWMLTVARPVREPAGAAV